MRFLNSYGEELLFLSVLKGSINYFKIYMLAKNIRQIAHVSLKENRLFVCLLHCAFQTDNTVNNKLMFIVVRDYQELQEPSAVLAQEDQRY